ncbi:MAG: hypothetical protein WDW36_008413 [Sanguina aurantia]
MPSASNHAPTDSDSHAAAALHSSSLHASSSSFPRPQGNTGHLLGSVSASLLGMRQRAGTQRAGPSISSEGLNAVTVRCFHPWYYHSRLRDHKITAMKSVEDLQGLLEEEKMKLSFINLARFMQRLHQLMPAPRGELEPDVAMRVDSLAQEVGQLMKKRAKWYCPRFGAMAIHQSALVGYTNTEMLDLILPRVLARMKEAYSKDLALLLNGLAMHSHPGGPELHAAIFNFLEVKIPTQRVPPENVSRILKSMIRLGVPVPPPVLQLVAEDLMLRQSIFSPENMAGVVWALAYSRQPAPLLDDRALNALCAHMLTHSALCSGSVLLWFVCSVDVLLKGLDMKALQARAPARHHPLLSQPTPTTQATPQAGASAAQDSTQQQQGEGEGQGGREGGVAGGAEAAVESGGGGGGGSEEGSGGLSITERRAVWERLPAGGALLRRAAEIALKEMPTASPEAAAKALLYLGGYTGLRLEASFHTALADRVSGGLATYTNMQTHAAAASTNGASSQPPSPTAHGRATGSSALIGNNDTTDGPATPRASLRVKTRTPPPLLVSLTSVFTTSGLKVMTASISREEGLIHDVFRLQTLDGDKVPEQLLPEIESKIVALTSITSRSTKPAIYGIVAAAEVERLRPLVGKGAKSEVQLLELSAAQMALAAAELVAKELEILTLRESGTVTEKEILVKEGARAEAATVLERMMKKMEAAMSARRVLVTRTETPSQDTADTTVASGCGSGFEILFQGFNWDSHAHAYYKTLSGKIPELAAAGFTAIWLPPPSEAVSSQGYLPGDYYNLDSAYGSESELRDLISVMKEHGVKAIADIVINHRCAERQGPDGKWNQFGGKMAWDESAICSDNQSFGGKGAPKTGDDYEAAPNVDHTKDFVRKDITEWMQWLKSSVGFDGWRYDFVRGYQGSFAKTYNEATSPEMSFGEYWDSCSYTDGVLDYNQDSHRQQTIDWCDSTGGTSGAFDFTTKGILQEAAGRQEYWRLIDGKGRPPGVLGMWASRAITFVDNHDTGSTLQHWPFPADNLPEGYAYILTHPGTPTVFYDHFWEEKNGLSGAVRELVALRRKHGIHCRSKVVIKKAVNDVYAAVVDDKLVVKLGRGDWSPSGAGLLLQGQQPQMASCGLNFAVWEVPTAPAAAV